MVKKVRAIVTEAWADVVHAETKSFAAFKREWKARKRKPSEVYYERDIVNLHKRLHSGKITRSLLPPDVRFGDVVILTISTSRKDGKR